MKKVLSISIGSSTRDHRGTLQIGSETISIERKGVDGDLNLAKQWMTEYDGKIDAFGAGGYIINFHVADRYYPLRSVKKIIKVIHYTPIVDGSGVKDTIERKVMQKLPEEFQEIKGELNGKSLITSAVDRYGMALSLEEYGEDLLIGDFMFALGLKIRVRSMTTFRRLCRVLLPFMSWFPISWLYPTGEKQLLNNPKFEKEFQKPTILAGDYLYIKQFAPKDLSGKVIVTNTTTAEDRDDLKDRGARALITTTPQISGRSYGTNVLESVLVAHKGLGRPLDQAEIQELVDRYQLSTELEIF